MAVWARGRKPRHYKIHIISVNNPVFRPSIHENPFSSARSNEPPQTLEVVLI